MYRCDQRVYGSTIITCECGGGGEEEGGGVGEAPTLAICKMGVRETRKYTVLLPTQAGVVLATEM